MANQEFLYGLEQKLSANTFTYYEGHDFSIWNTKSDGAGYTYNNGQSVTSIAGATANSTVTLYAIWNNLISLSSLTGNFVAIDGDILTGVLVRNYKISIADGATVRLLDVTINGNNDINSKT